MGIFDKFRKKKEKEPSDMELYNAYLVNMGKNMKLARSEYLTARVHHALEAIRWGIKAYRVFHPVPPDLHEDLRILSLEVERDLERLTDPDPTEKFSLSSLRRQFGEEFGMGYKKLKENKQKVSKEEDSELVKESIELMEKLAKRIREMLGLM